MPKITLQREPLVATIDIIERSGAIAQVERAEGEGVGSVNEVYVVLNADYNADRYVDDTVEPTKTYKYRVKLNDLASSVLIIEDNSALTPPYYVAEPTGGAVFTLVDTAFVIPWTTDIEIPIIEISNLRKTKYSRTKTGTG